MGKRLGGEPFLLVWTPNWGKFDRVEWRNASQLEFPIGVEPVVGKTKEYSLF